VATKLFLGDHWERSYGDLERRGEVPNRTMPWYFMAWDGRRADGYGVSTSLNAFCFWNADCSGVTLLCEDIGGGVESVPTILWQVSLSGKIRL
jgi:alpha-galactosidase